MYSFKVSLFSSLHPYARGTLMWCMMHCKQLHGTSTAEHVVDACDREMIGPVHNQMPFSHTYPSTLTLLEIDVRVCTVQQHSELAQHTSHRAFRYTQSLQHHSEHHHTEDSLTTSRFYA